MNNFDLQKRPLRRGVLGSGFVSLSHYAIPKTPLVERRWTTRMPGDVHRCDMFLVSHYQGICQEWVWNSG
ncbi:MAG: hypothetical protein V4449_03145 [Patescibacteria group bacterium]